MGIGSSSRFKRDAEFLIGCPSREARLQKLITKQASRIITTTSSFSILVSLARAGDCNALLCSLDVSRQALTAPQSAAQRDLAKKLRALFGSKARPAHAAQCIFTFTTGQCKKVTLGRLVVPRVDGTMPFLAAAEAGHWHVILWMASEGVNVLTHDERTGFGVLHAAARGGQPALLQHLLAWDIEVLDNDGTSPLNSSSHRTLDGGAVYKWVDFPGMGRATPLMVAAYYGQGECVRVLVQAGADITHSLRGGAVIPLPSGSTTMHCAARGRSTQVAVELLKALYTANGGPLVDTATNSSMRLEWEGNTVRDLRARPNNLGVLPTSYARIVPSCVALERMLHPRLPLALVIRQEDPSWSGFDGGVPRLYNLALEALRKYHLSTLDELERVRPADGDAAASDTCFKSAPGKQPWGAPQGSRGSAGDLAVHGGGAAAAALAALPAPRHSPPAVVHFASASRDNLLLLQPSTRSLSTLSLRELSMVLDGPGRGLGEAEMHADPFHAGMQARSAVADVAEVAGPAPSSAGTLANTWSELAETPRRQVVSGLGIQRAHSSHHAPQRSRSPFELTPMTGGVGSSSTGPLRAQGRAAGSGVRVGSGSSTWHGGTAFVEAPASHGHFRIFSAPGTAREVVQSSSNAMTNELHHDTLDGVETESELELQWALYSAQMESTRHSMKGAAAAGSGIGAGSIDEDGEEVVSQQDAMPLLSRMVASVDRAVLRMPQMPHMMTPAPMLSSLRGALRAGADNGSVHSSRSSNAAAELSRRQQSLASMTGSLDPERRCPICMDELTCVRVAGCKHGMCVACARTLCTSVSRAPACPLCRKTVDTFERVVPQCAA